MASERETLAALMAFYPLNVMDGNRNLCHIETDAGAKVGQGVAICSVPRKYQAVAQAMVDGFNKAMRAEHIMASVPAMDVVDAIIATKAANAPIFVNRGGDDAPR